MPKVMLGVLDVIREVKGRPTMTKRFKVAMLSPMLVAAATIAAYAAPTPPQTQSPPQVAANPGIPNVNAGQAGGTNGHWVWVPTSPAPQTASGAAGIRTEDGQSYSKKGFGPTPN